MRNKRVTWLASGCVLLSLAGCGTLRLPAPGSPAQDATVALGEPSVSCPRAGGGYLWVWTRQPWGTEAWAAQVGADGRLETLAEVLTDAAFAALASGTWSREQVRCHFGPPAEVSRVGLPSQRQEVWSYRYRREGVWPALMHVYLGAAGDRVTRFHAGPDPLHERWPWGF